jgi:hypothetical protein
MVADFLIMLIYPPDTLFKARKRFHNRIYADILVVNKIFKKFSPEAGGCSRTSVLEQATGFDRLYG